MKKMANIFDIDLFNQKLSVQVKNNKITEETKTYYMACLDAINKKTVGTEDVAKAIDEICKGSKQGEKYISAVKKYERDVLDAPKSILFGTKLLELRQKHKLPSIGIEIKMNEATYLKKINRLNNERLKLALRLQHKSGLRISEIASLSREDIIFDENNEIRVLVRNGKGGKARAVDVNHDEWLFRRLQMHLEPFAEAEKVFYSSSYLKKKATALGIPTHDLRRINSRERFRNQRGTGESRRSARREVQKQLGHESPKTTNAYLGKEWSEEEEEK